MTNLTHNSFFICLFQFSTCSKQTRAHHQENQFYQYNIWYVLLCVGDGLVCRSPTQSDTYQMLYWYNWFSWWWARDCSKHIEDWNKHMKNNCASSWSFTRSNHFMFVCGNGHAVMQGVSLWLILLLLSVSIQRSVTQGAINVQTFIV
jgi:hypothetical protein